VRQQAPDASDAWDGARRDAEQAAAHRAQHCYPALADADAGRWVVQAPDVPVRDAWSPPLERWAQQLRGPPDAAEPYKRAVGRSAERSFAARAAAPQPGVLGALEQWLALEARQTQLLVDAAQPAQRWVAEQSQQVARAGAPQAAEAAEQAEAAQELNTQAVLSAAGSSRADAPAARARLAALPSPGPQRQRLAGSTAWQAARRRAG
jgi:hypothetical protein